MTRLIFCPPDKRLPPKRRREAFLRAYLATGSVSFAAACAGVDRTTPYVWRSQDLEFAQVWDAGRAAARTRHPGLEIMKRRASRKGLNDQMLIYALGRTGQGRARNSTERATADIAKAVAAQVAKAL